MKKILILIFVIINSVFLFAQKDNDKQLIIAASENNEKKVLELLRKGANPNAKTYNGITPLMYAAESGNYFICLKLLEYNANVDIKPKYAPSALITATQHRNTKIVELFANNNANLNITDYNGNTALIYASADGYIQIADILLFHGASPSFMGNNIDALMAATYYNDTLMMKLLIDNKANINSADDYGFTPLMIASQFNKIEAVKILVENKADINLQNKDGHTALSIAIYNKNNDIVEYLLSKDAKIDNKISKKILPYELCIIRENSKAKKLLKKHKAKKGFIPIFTKIPIGFIHNFNQSDYMLGTEFGIQESRYKIDFYGGIITRPFRKKIWQEQTPNYYHQLNEKRSIIYLQIDKRFSLFNISYLNFGTTIGIKGIYTFGNYSATFDKIEPNFYYAPQIGLFMKGDFFYFKISTEYLHFNELKNDDFRINLSFYYLINTINFKTKSKYIYW